LVSYQGDRGSFAQRLYRRDLLEQIDDPVQLAANLIYGRHGKNGSHSSGDFESSRLARRTILAYAQRAALLRFSTARWRMGLGNPVPLELITGSGQPEMILASLELLNELVLDFKKVVFVPPSLEMRGILTIGDALNPGEFAIVKTIAEDLRSIVEGHSYAPPILKQLKSFVGEVGPKLVVGCYRASAIGPARLFYAHVDHAHEAAVIAMADSRLLAHRSFPVLLDLAGELCRQGFGSEDFEATVRDAYTMAGQPYAYHQDFARA
jgi:hypothetical protein